VKVHCIVSSFKKTNNYLVEIKPNIFIGIDIGFVDFMLIQNVLKKYNGTLVAYFLTHSHADHSFGLKEVLEHYKIPVYNSYECAIELANSRKNFSFYLDDIPTFEYNFHWKIINDFDSVDIQGVSIDVCLVPGHSPGCVMYKINDLLFSGDFLMNTKTPLNFPNSSKKAYQNSVEKVKKTLGNQSNSLICYSGHGDSFLLSDHVFFKSFR
jgi:glyoxylase-like metal-dependent hydrolase (beta-lactamase superfamily II)